MFFVYFLWGVDFTGSGLISCSLPSMSFFFSFFLFFFFFCLGAQLSHITCQVELLQNKREPIFYIQKTTNHATQSFPNKRNPYFLLGISTYKMLPSKQKSLLILVTPILISKFAVTTLSNSVCIYPMWVSRISQNYKHLSLKAITCSNQRIFD